MASKLFVVGAVLVLSLRLTTAKDLTCIVDDIQVQDNFDLKRYLGTWYEIYWILPFYVPDPFTDYNHVYEDLNSTHLISHTTGRSYEGECFNKDHIFEKTTGAKYIKVTDKGNPFWILKTDYDNYSVTYGCDEKFENGTCAMARGWIWSRNKTISEENRNLTTMILDQACIASSKLLKTNQTNECKDSAAGLPSYSKTITFVVLVFVKLCIG